jgi:hypothetical protein
VLAPGLAAFSKSPEGKQVPGAATAGFLAPGGKARRHAGLRDVLFRYEGKMPGFTSNMTAVPASAVPSSAWE